MDFSGLRASPTVRLAGSIAREQGAAVFLVGGAVRDSLRDRAAPRDLDFVVDGDLAAFAGQFAQTVRGALIPWDRDQIRVVYSAGGGRVCCDFSRLHGGDIRQDLQRRDFTVNACAVAVGQLLADAAPPVIDPCGGQRDLSSGRLVCCGPSCFPDDPVRMLRSLRIARECDLMLDGSVVDGMVRHAGLITTAARERVKHEFFMVLGCPDAHGSLRLLDDTGLLACIIPEITAFRTVRQTFPHCFDLFRHQMETVRRLDGMIAEGFARFEPYAARMRDSCDGIVEECVTRRSLLTFTAFVHDSGKMNTGRTAQGRMTFHGHEQEGAVINRALCRRLGLGRTAQRLVYGLTLTHMRLLQLSLQETVTARAQIRLIRDCEDVFWELLPLATADRLAAGDPDAESAAAAIQRLAVGLAERRCAPAYLRQRSPLLTGTDVRRVLNIPAGPEIGTILDELHERERRGLCTTRDEALQWLTTRKPQHSK